MSRRKQRAIAVLLSTGLGLILVGWILSRRGHPGTVKLVEVRSDIEEYFHKRSLGPSEVHAAETSTPIGPAATGAPAGKEPPPLMVGKFNYAELPKPLARRMFPGIRQPNRRLKYDPHTFFSGKPGFRTIMKARGMPIEEFSMVNNSLGLRRATEVSDSVPDLRVLVTGDSHVEGVVPMEAHLTEVTEAALEEAHPGRSVEVLNAGVGGYSFFNYLGVIEKYRDLRPDVFVVVVYGGNDFTGCLSTYRFFHRLPLGVSVPKEVRPTWKRLMGDASQLFAQSFDQAIKLHFQPRERALAREASAEFVREVHAICEARGVPLVLMYLPSLLEVQPQYDQGTIQRALGEMNIAYEDLKEGGELADSMLADAQSLGITCIDLRPAFRNAEQRLYWEFDHHLNVRGHALVAEQLTAQLVRLGHL